MKSLIGRRIVILMSITIISTSAFIAFLGLYLSEDVISHIKSQAYIPDLTVMSNVAGAYMKGEISTEAYTSIVSGSEQLSHYIIFDKNGEVYYKSQLFPQDAEMRIYQVLNEVMSGDTFVERTSIKTEPVTELVGVPVQLNNNEAGCIFAIVEVFDMSQVNQRFYTSLFISIAAVIGFVIIVSRPALKRITKPITNVVTVAIAMTEGDFSKEADETLEGEIGFLGKTLNKMSRDLYKNVSQLYVEKNRLDHVMNSIEEGMIAIDRSMTISHTNDVFFDMFKVDKSWSSHLKIDKIPIIKDRVTQLAEVLSDRKAYTEKCDYRGRIYRIMFEPIENERLEVVGAVMLFRDITEVENLEQTRRNYVANVSHELRSPLTSIQALIEPLMDGIVKRDEDKHRYYEIIHKETRRLNRLVDDTMELSRLQMNNMSIEKETIDMNIVLEQLYERYCNYSDQVELIYDRKELPSVVANGDRIEQVLVILLDNAYKYMGDGHWIKLETEIEGEKLWVSIIDDGIGIEEEHIPHVFERFYKADQSRTKKSTGLGLSIAKEILDIMGEHIICQSTIGEGTTFSFSITLD